MLKASLILSVCLNLAIGAVAQVVQFDFTAEEGFRDGDVSDQGRWLSNRPGNRVDADGAGSVILDSQTGWVISICSVGLSATAESRITVSANFTFQEEGPAGQGDIIGLVAHDNMDTSFSGLRASMRRHDEIYWLVSKSESGAQLASEFFAKSALGLGEQVGRASDELTLSMTLLRGNNSSDWTVTTTLSNATQSAEVLSITQSNLAMSAEFYNAPHLFFGFSSAVKDKDAGLMNRTITRFTVDHTDLKTGNRIVSEAVSDYPETSYTGKWTHSSSSASGGGAQSLSGNEKMVASPATKDIGLFDIPGALRELSSTEELLQKKIDALPRLNDSLQFEAYGYHGGYLPLLETLPDEPRWTVELTFANYISFSKIILVPAVDHRFGRLGSYGFPQRFRVLTVGNDGSMNVIKEWMDEDCPDPGRFPVILDVPPPGDRRVRIEVYRGYQDGGRELFALDEVYGIMDGTDHLCHDVKVSSEYESLPYWGRQFIIDQKTSLGLPLDVREEKSSGPAEEDFAVAFDAAPENGCVVELDLGQNRKLGWVTLFPAQSPAGIKIPGYGFPGTIIMDIVEEDASGKRGIVRRVPWDWRELQPGNNVLHLACGAMSGRWIRLHLDDLPLHNGKPTFAMGEVHVYNWNVTYPVQSIRLEQFPENVSEHTALMRDGEAGGYPILFLLDWLHKIERRNEFTLLLEEVMADGDLLEWRWKNFWRIAGIGTALLLALTALSFAGIVLMQRQKALKKLKWRIARDLHDEVGSSLGSISLTAERLEHDAMDDGMREDLADLQLLAREASASLRDVVWVIDQTIIRLPELIKKMKERAERVLSGVELTISMPKQCPDREVSLTFKRHIMMFFKEVVHNCARHSGATRVQIIFSINNQQFELSVKDNGCGFSADELRDGWGLDSMEKRAQELEATMSLNSEPGEGTEISLSVPLRVLLTQTDNLYKTSN